MIVYEVCVVIWAKVSGLCFPELNEQEWLDIAESFNSRAHFPNCLGAIDGKHVRLVCPKHTGSEYWNYKKFYSLVLLAVCDSNYRFIFIDVGSYGKASDSAIFKNSELYAKLMNGSLNFPPAKAISLTGGPLPFVFVGDEAFGLSNHMLRPYASRNLDKKKRIFNYRLCRARRYIENTFGILANKWRIFHRPIAGDIEKVEAMVRACCTLHNYVRARDGVDYDLMNGDTGFVDDQNNQQGHPRPATTIRDEFSEYFSSEEGALPWQDRMI